MATCLCGGWGGGGWRGGEWGAGGWRGGEGCGEVERGVEGGGEKGGVGMCRGEEDGQTGTSPLCKCKSYMFYVFAFSGLRV